MVEHGVWKLDTIASGIANLYGGKMNLLVHPSYGRTSSLVVTYVSRPRMTVTPTASTLCLSLLVLFIRSAVSSDMISLSESILCLERSSTSTERKCPMPMCRVMNALFISLRIILLKSSRLKCSPAAGAETAPSCAANIVWKFSASSFVTFSLTHFGTGVSPSPNSVDLKSS